MNWLNDSDRVKVLKYVIALNLFAALINLAIFGWNVYTLNWLGILNLVCFFFSANQAYKSFKLLPVVKKEQEEKILDILKGRYI